MRCIRLGSENIEYELFLPKVVKGCGWKAFDVCKKEEEAFDGEEEFFHKELHCHHIFVRTVENLLGLQSTIALFFFLFRHVHLKFIEDFTVFLYKIVFTLRCQIIWTLEDDDFNYNYDLLPDVEKKSYK